MKPLIDRIRDGSTHNEDSKCVEWNRHCNADGYGMLWLNGKSERTHRASWIAHKGEIPKGMHVLHKCDNRKCVNQDHLFLGTHADNMADKVKKSRQARPAGKRGEAHYKTTLTNDDVVDMRIMLCNESTSYRAMALLYDVSPMTVCNIKNRNTWTHI